MLHELIIYQKHYDLMLYAFPVISRFPKNQRFVLGQQIQNCMVGYRIWATHRLLRKSSSKRMRRKLKAFARAYESGDVSFETINASVQSWLGHAGHANTYRLRCRLFADFVLAT